jgi:hypothetical protein
MLEIEAVKRYFGQVVNPVLLVLLLWADLAFLLLHISYKMWPLSNVLFDLSTDRGYSEVFQYIKEYWISIALFSICCRTREGIYGSWALLFTYFLCDDALSIHEGIGQLVANQWNYVPALGLRDKDFGELTVSVLVGSAFLVMITSFYLRSSNSAKNVSKDLTVMLAVLVFFGVFVDMVHIAVSTLFHVQGLTIVEDSGEMVTMSIITSYVVHLQERQTFSPK